MTQTLTLDYGYRVAEAGNGFVARIRQGLADYRLYRSTIEELAQLTDRDLADLGIHRSMLRDIARRAVYGN